MNNSLSENDELKKKLDEIDSTINSLKDYDTIQVHKNIADIQRQAYKKHNSNVEDLKGKILIEVDYKQKITVGMSPRQVSSEYYNQISRTCLGKKIKFIFSKFFLNLIEGFGIYFVDNQNKIQSINFTIISSDMTEDARSVIRGFRILRKQEFFMNIEKPNFIIWMDCGKHFRNCEVVGYLLNELAEEKIHGNLTFLIKFLLTIYSFF